MEVTVQPLAVVGIRESRPICHETPTANMQIFRLDVLEAHETLYARGERVGGQPGRDGDYVSKAGEGHGRFSGKFLPFCFINSNKMAAEHQWGVLWKSNSQRE